MWTWGLNSYGQIGDGTTTTRLTPVQVEDLTDVTAVSMGYDQTFALKSDGTVWAWGHNNEGQLGDGTTIDRLTPVQVEGLTDVTAIEAGNYQVIAIKSDGTVWTWGQNTTGQLGNGTSTSKGVPFPAQVSAILSVTYNYSENGGTAATKTAYSLMKNSAVDLTPTATKAGWEFVGWNTSKDATAALASLNIGTENITLYAIYKKTFTGTFIDYNGITKQTRTVPVTIYNKATSGSLTAPTQSTYTNWSSIGWSTATAANAAVTVNGGGPAVLLLIPPSMACISAH